MGFSRVQRCQIIININLLFLLCKKRAHNFNARVHFILFVLLLLNLNVFFLLLFIGNLYEEGRRGETIFEDFLIRKFMFGTWHTNLASEVVIKRRYNVITLSFLVAMDRLLPRQVYFLQGYTEELLSNWLKCPVKVELQTVDSFDDVIFKKI